MIHYPKGYKKAKAEYRKEKWYLAGAILLLLLMSSDILEANMVTDFVREVAVEDDYC